MIDQDVIQNTEQSAFLTTKLFIPRSSAKQVARPPLIEKLNGFRDHKMTLVSAPAGFGKTTILTQWVTQLDDPVAWLSLDERDNDPYIFLQYFIAALQSVDANLGVAAAYALQAANKQSLAAILIPLLNDISTMQNQLCVVLDDYHCIQSHEVHEILRYMLEHLPPQLHLILSTRADPPLSLAKMRARSSLSELRIGELCFSREDIVSFFHTIMGLELSEKEISTLEHRTEGWAAGLQLAAVSLKGCEDIQEFIKAFAGDNRYIVDYLVEEVLQKQNHQTHNFLLRTSVLQQMSAELCDYLLEINDSQAILENLEQQNLFIVPLDSNRKWFRYHHLFADLLHQRLRQKEKDAISSLRIRASKWYEKNGYIHSAIDYALAAEDFQRTAILLEQVADNDWQYDKRTKLSHWLNKLPIKYIHKHPELCLYYVWVLMDDNKQEDAERSLVIVENLIEQQAEKHIDDAGNLDTLDLKEIHGKVKVLRALMETGRGDAERIIDHSAEALKYLPENSHTWRANSLLAQGVAYSLKGNLHSAVYAYTESMRLSKMAGNLDLYFRASIWLVARLTYAAQLDKATKICEEIFDVIEKSNLEQSLFSAGAFLSWGNILYELNRLDEAYEYINKDYEIIEAALDISHKAWCYCCMIKVLIAQNDSEGLRKIVKKLEKLESIYELPFSFLLLTGSWKAKMWLNQGEMDKVGGWLEENSLSVADEIVAYRDLGHIILVRYLLALNKIDDAKYLLEKLILAQEKLGRTLLLIEVLLIQAQVLKNEGDWKGAIDAVVRALQLGEKGKCARVFLNEGQPVADILEKMLAEKRDIPRAFVQKLLAEFKISEIVETERKHESEILSERELEILRLIAAGLSNKKIMEKLYISLSTVKTHLRNIYSKLDAHSRTAAVAKANELNLL